MGLCMGIAFLYAVALLLVIFPTRIVAWYAAYTRDSYPDQRSLEQADQYMVFNPLSKFLIGKVSDYAARGPEHPEDFPRMIWFVRLMGLIPMIFYTVGLICVFLKR